MTNNPSIGLPNGKVTLLPYTRTWMQLFEDEKALLQAALGSQVLDIQHVSSTSIPGMPAKPIIDIAIAVINFEDARVCILPIQHLGYEYKGELGIPRRHYFTKGNPRTFHIHMNEIGSRDWADQIFFRDYLTRHPQCAQEYADLKLGLAKQFPHDREAYLAGKAPYIQHILQLAGKETI